MENAYNLSMTDLVVNYKILPKDFTIESEELIQKVDTDLGALIKVFETRINVRIDGNPDPSDFKFEKTKFDFKNETTSQILLIDTSRLRFIRIIESISIELAEVKNHVHLDGMAVDHGLPEWPPVRLTEKFDILTDAIIITFKIPPNTPYFSFFIRLHLKPDGRYPPYFDCDPQVGNDPPVVLPLPKP